MIEQLFPDPQPYQFSCTVTLFPFHSKIERICDCEPFYNLNPDGPQFKVFCYSQLILGRELYFPELFSMASVFLMLSWYLE